MGCRVLRSRRRPIDPMHRPGRHMDQSSSRCADRDYYVPKLVELSTSFGTRGSQVQILPLRPALSWIR